MYLLSARESTRRPESTAAACRVVERVHFLDIGRRDLLNDELCNAVAGVDCGERGAYVHWKSSEPKLKSTTPSKPR